MKKIFMLLIAGSLVAAANAQQAQKSVVFNAAMAQNLPVAANSDHGPAGIIKTPASHAHRTTAGPGGSRWYDYVDSVFELNTTISVTPGNDGLDIWQDTTAIFGYTGGTTIYSGNDFTSYGLGLDPFTATWNDADTFPGEIAITPEDAYTIDSVHVSGFYGRNNAKTGVVDTLVLTFMQGNGGLSSDMPADTFTAGGTTASYYGLTSSNLNYLSLYHDSLNNRVGHNGGTPVTTGIYKMPLISTDTNSTSRTVGGLGMQFPRPGRTVADPVISYKVSAGNYAAMTVSFISGDNTYPAFPAQDTVRYSNGTIVTGYKYGMFRGLIMYNETTPTSNIATWPPYTEGDLTSGYFKLEGPRDVNWVNKYVPNWPWHIVGVGGNASSLQYPYIWYHVQCSTCALTTTSTKAAVKNIMTAINSVNAYPNPVSGDLNIFFNVTQADAVSISLTNMIGQVVATQHINNIAKGKAIFNTSTLPDGVYIYTLQANGARSTGRVIIAH